MRPARRRCRCGPLRYRLELVLCWGELPTSPGARRVCRGVPPMCCPGLRRVTPELRVCWPAAVLVAHDLVVVRAEMPAVRRAR